MVSSGLTLFNPSIADYVLEAYDRIQLRPPAIVNEHMVSARMSCNLLQASWAVRNGIDLWKVDQQIVPLVQGVTTYAVPTDTIQVLDVYIRQYYLSSPINITPAFATTINSSTVVVNQANHGLSVGQYISIVIYTAIGGLVLYGFYLVQSVTSVNQYTIMAASNAATTASGGFVPIFTTTANSTTVSVNLPNHGFVAGGTFVVQIATEVGGVQLFGSYTVLAVTDANNFTFTASYAAGSNQILAENGGQTQIAPQQQSPGFNGYVDRILSPISRTDYASLPNKYQQGFPSVYWWDRLINSTLTIWQVPDGSGPYQLIYYRMGQIQDANPQMGQTADIPYRFTEAFCAELAWHLARKWKPELEAIRKADAITAWNEAASQDREIVTLNLTPDTDDYFR